MITLRVDEDVALDMLMDRLEQWTDDTTTNELFRDMYQRMLDDRVFEGMDFDVRTIVDNDYVNWCTVVEEGDELYDKCKEAWENGESELVEDGCYIEAEANGAYLIHW